MIFKLFDLEIKQFFRSSYWQKGVILNIFLGFAALILILNALVLGFGLYPLLEERFPDKNPLEIVNSFFFYWFMGDVLFRFFLQKLPVFSIKPMLYLPIKKSKIIHYILGKTVFSFFTFLPLFFIVPFGISLINNGFDLSTSLTWMTFLFLATLIANYLNFIIENKSAESDLSFLPIMLIASGLIAFNYFKIISISGFFAKAINFTIEAPIYLIVPIVILVLFYYFNYKSLKRKIYLDQSLASKTNIVHATDMSWLQKLGPVAPFMQLDLKMIGRNKRPRSSIFLLVLGMLYGLMFYPKPQYENLYPMLVFVGIFITGNFMINFGQFIPAWDSGYYRFLMSQNIKYKEYIRSKFVLMAASAVIMFIFSIPYVYFGWKILVLNFAATIFNIGVNTHVLLYAGSFNRKKIDLDKRAAFNYQGTGAVQWLLGLPLLVIPIFIFYIPYKLFSFDAGVFSLILFGVIGIVLHKKLINYIAQKYNESKYKMIKAFDQE